jgi:hypothetical protein
MKTLLLEPGDDGRSGLCAEYRANLLAQIPDVMQAADNPEHEKHLEALLLFSTVQRGVGFHPAFDLGVGNYGDTLDCCERMGAWLSPTGRQFLYEHAIDNLESRGTTVTETMKERLREELERQIDQA